MNDDIQAIKNLIFAYAEAFDLGDFDAAVGLFRDASVQVAGADVELRGEEARLLLTGMVQTYEGIPRTKHLTTNVVVEIEDGDAVARSYFVAIQAVDGFPLQPIISGRWHDTFKKVDGRWRFDTRVIHADLIGDISRHLTGGQ